VRRRVLFLAPNLEGGGAQKVLRGWVDALVANGDSVVVAVTDLAEHEIPGAEVVLLGGGGRGGIGRKLRGVSALARDSDVVIALMPYWNLLAIVGSLLIGRGNRPRVVISEHTMLYAHRARSMHLADRLKVRVARLLYRRADALVAVSHSVAAEMISAYRVEPEKIWVVPNACIADVTLPTQVQAVSPDDELALLFAGRLVPEKTPGLVLAVAGRLAARGIPVRVHFFGAGPLQDDLTSLAREAGIAVEFHGMVHEWWQRAPSTGVILLPSSIEGFGNVLVEAAAAGIPAVASSRALGVADAILDGVTGILVPSHSPDALAHAVVLARSLRPIPDVRGWLRKFTPAAVAERLEELLEAVS